MNTRFMLSASFVFALAFSLLLSSCCVCPGVGLLKGVSQRPEPTEKQRADLPLSGVPQPDGLAAGFGWYTQPSGAFQFPTPGQASCFEQPLASGQAAALLCSDGTGQDQGTNLKTTTFYLAVSIVEVSSRGMSEAEWSQFVTGIGENLQQECADVELRPELRTIEAQGCRSSGVIYWFYQEAEGVVFIYKLQPLTEEVEAAWPELVGGIRWEPEGVRALVQTRPPAVVGPNPGQAPAYEDLESCLNTCTRPENIDFALECIETCGVMFGLDPVPNEERDDDGGGGGGGSGGCSYCYDSWQSCNSVCRMCMLDSCDPNCASECDSDLNRCLSTCQ